MTLSRLLIRATRELRTNPKRLYYWAAALLRGTAYAAYYPPIRCPRMLKNASSAAIKSKIDFFCQPNV